MAEAQEDKSIWPKIIASVTSFRGLSSLSVLAAGPAFTAALVKVPVQDQFWLFAVLVTLLILILCANLTYDYIMKRYELTFEIHVVRRQKNGQDIPIANAQVELYKDNTLLHQTSTNSMGVLTLTIGVAPGEAIYIIVEDETGRKRPKAVLYSSVQSAMEKTIRL